MELFILTLSTRASIRLSALVLAASVIAACSGLGGEPPIVATLPPPTAVPPIETAPDAAPDIARGAAVYAERCVACHGLTGAGDGELVRSGQVAEARNFREPSAARAQRPSEWYATITNGRIGRLMPPWREALSAADRWAVALYTYTLHYTPEQIALGRERYSAHCAECHGSSGRGDGERAAEFGGYTPNLTRLDSIMTLSDEHLFNIITEGHGAEMQGFADILSEDERRAVAAYVRTLSLANADSIGQTVQVAQVDTDTTASTITGRVTNGTAGGGVPSALPVRLVYFDENLTQTTLETTTGADGAFAFADVPISAAFRYAAVVEYRGVTFISDISAGDPAAGALDLPVTIYELTEDPAVITITGTVMQVNAMGEGLEVAQVFTLRNGSDRAYVTDQRTPDGRRIAAAISLPPGSIAFLENEARFVIAQDQFTVLDTVPVLPGQDTVIALAYFIPYTGSAIIEQPFNYRFMGEARVLLRQPNLILQSDQLAQIGAQTVGANEWQGFGGRLSLNAGDALRFDLSGAPQDVTARGSEPFVISNNLLPLLIAGIAVEIALVIALFAWWRRRRQRRAAAAAPTQQPTDQALLDGLIRQIAELDAQHERGEIDAALYERQRGALKARLTKLLERAG